MAARTSAFEPVREPLCQAPTARFGAVSGVSAGVSRMRRVPCTSCAPCMSCMSCVPYVSCVSVESRPVSALDGGLCGHRCGAGEDSCGVIYGRGRGPAPLHMQLHGCHSQGWIRAPGGFRRGRSEKSGRSSAVTSSDRVAPAHGRFVPCDLRFFVRRGIVVGGSDGVRGRLRGVGATGRAFAFLGFPWRFGNSGGSFRSVERSGSTVVARGREGTTIKEPNMVVDLSAGELSDDLRRFPRTVFPAFRSGKALGMRGRRPAGSGRAPRSRP
ncbi:hypothetical protein EHYA_06214 [Embleya hyalina]|uniref:Uncharacterized protein n=1 Tax=Embleya hyalina TaxID=516124 RepID=A0A401YV82_9ACTN|nr:hypothetical protein EHYA_06214 [Embleya hyalina]